MTKLTDPESQAVPANTTVSPRALRFQRPNLSPDEKKALLAEYIAYYEQVLNEQGLQALNVKAPRAVFVPILDKIEALIHAEVDAICSRQHHEIHTFLNENPLPDCLNTLLPKEFRVYSLFLNALKQWVAAKSADTDKFLLGGRAREYCRDAAECCIVTKAPLSDESRVELHHPMRDGRPSLPLSKHGHNIVENQTPRRAVHSEKNLQAEDFTSPWEHICWLRKERHQSWTQLQEGCMALCGASPSRSGAKSFAHAVVASTGLSPHEVLHLMKAQGASDNEDISMDNLDVPDNAASCAHETVGGIGALVGDVVGSPYEFDHNNIKTEDFPLFSENSRLTDDSVMTQAVADGFIETWGLDDVAVREGLIRAMMREGKKYPRAGYGAMFRRWLKNPESYGSYGNGSAMRVSSAGWLFDQLDDVLKYATISAEISHNHPEGIKGAQATALAIYLTRCGLPKDKLRAYLTQQFGYNLERTLNDIRPDYHHVESCMETVPEALIAYFEGQDFEDVVRKAVSLGGDSDTLTAIAGSVAEARYGIPASIRQETLNRMDDHQLQLLDKFARFQKAKFSAQRACMEQLLALLPAFASYPSSCNDEALSSFVDLVHNESITMHSYLELLKIFNMSNVFDLDDAQLETCSILVLRAILTFIGRSERFCSGALEDAAQSGFIARVLQVLQKQLRA